MLPTEKQNQKKVKKIEKKANFNLKFSSDVISLEMFSLRTLWASYSNLHIYD